MDIDGSSEAVEENLLFVEEVIVSASRRAVNRSTLPIRHVPTQKFSLHIIPFFGSVYKYALLFEEIRQKLPSQWPVNFRRHFYCVHVKTLLVSDASAQVAKVEKSIIF